MSELTPEQFSQANTQPFVFESAERHREALKEALEIRVLHGLDGQRFSALYMNRDFAGVPLIKPGPFLGTIAGPSRIYEAMQFAAALPNRPVLLVDMPAHGLSDAFTWEQKREMAHTRRVSLAAYSMGTAIKGLLPGTETFSAAGDSTGGIFGLEMSLLGTQLQWQPDKLIGFEMGALDRRSSIGLMLAFYIKETIEQKRYKKGEAGAHLRRAFDKFETEELKAAGYTGEHYSLYGIYGKDPLGVPLLIARNPMATNTGVELVEKTLAAYPESEVALVTGGISAVTRLKKILVPRERLLSQFPNRLRWDIWPEDNHGIGLPQQQPRLAKFAKFILESVEEGS